MEKSLKDSTQEDEQSEISSSLLDPVKDMKLKLYLVKFKDRVEMWAKAHSKEPHVASNPPIYWEESIQDFVWANRKQRRVK